MDALYDSGASSSFIQRELAKKLETVLTLPEFGEEGERYSYPIALNQA